MTKHTFDFTEGPGQVDFRLEGSDAERLVIKAMKDGTVRLKVYHEGKVLIQAVMCNQAAIEFGGQVSAIARDNE
jgi:hypothetical protein